MRPVPGDLGAGSDATVGPVTLDLIPATIIEDGPIWTLAVNRNQDLLGKTMVVLRRPCTAVVELTPEEWASLHHELRRVVAALRTLFQPDQLNFAFLMNLDAQVHLHVVPRYAGPRKWHGDTFIDANWGSAFGQEQRILQVADLSTLGEEIRGALPPTR